MDGRKRRRRTGCLTCRARRVKCDERRPVCERCEAGNLECSGYEAKRKISIKRSNKPNYGSVDQGRIIGILNATCEEQCHVVPYSNVTIRPDGLPLFGLPNNPTLSQRPHTRARDILAYHQYIFRTVPLLFRSYHTGFWGDFLCQEGWDTEYIYDAIMAIGGIHRASVMLSQRPEHERNRGVDTKVISFQAYARSLQEISEKEEEIRTTISFIGVLILFAYFQCFAGNIPAVIRHFNAAKHHFTRLADDDAQKHHLLKPAIQTSLQDLGLVAQIVLPFPNFTQSLVIKDFEVPTVTSINWTENLQALLAMSSTEVDIRRLIWSPMGLSSKKTAARSIKSFYEQLDKSKKLLETILAQYDVENSLSTPQHFTTENLQQLPVPPLPYTSMPLKLRLMLSLQIFYVVRTKWAQCLIDVGDHNTQNDLFFHLYQLMRLSVFDRNSKSNGDVSTGESWLACESLKIGFSPLLYLVSHCCPLSSWAEWITSRLKSIGQEGIFHTRAFSRNIQVQIEFEKHTIPMTRYDLGPARLRIFPVLIPYSDRNAFITYYLRWKIIGDEVSGIANTYELCGISRWSDEPHANYIPEVESFCDCPRVVTDEWLLNQPVIQKWGKWSLDPQFSVDRALCDHLVGEPIFSENNYVNS